MNVVLFPPYLAVAWAVLAAPGLVLAERSWRRHTHVPACILCRGTDPACIFCSTPPTRPTPVPAQGGTR